MANKKDKMTIEDLVGMMERNFPTKEEMNIKFSELKGELKSEIQEVKRDLQEVKIELEEVHDVVRRIDGQDLPNLKRRFTTLETNIKPLIK